MEEKDFLIEPPPKAGEEAEFFLQEALRPNARTCRAHIHNAIELLYINEGSYTAILDGTEYNIEKGDLILFCSNAIHHVYTRNQRINSYYVIKIPPSFFLNFSKFDMGSEYIMRFALHRKEHKNIWRYKDLENSQMQKILYELIEEHQTQGYAAEVATKLKIMELLLAILREDTNRPEIHNSQITSLIYEAMIYVREHYSEDIDEKQLAQSMGISYSYFIRSFRSVTGMTFKKYLNMTRINKAEQLLCKNNKSISEIAVECGYNSISYFISVYRSVTGKTPYKALRQQNTDE